MTASAEERLYHMLPAVYRQRDGEQGWPLRALLAVIEEELGELEGNIEQLYDDLFIETCQEWVVSYIGDLLGVHGLSVSAPDVFSQRAFVANTLRYRRRKGTAPVLEQIARDVTGWPARVVEFFQVLSTTQNLNHLRPEHRVTMELRGEEPLELLGGPFDPAARTVEVRRLPSGRGRFNIPNVGLYLWRLPAYTLVRTTARPRSNPPKGEYYFGPLARNVHPCNPPQTEREITHIAEETNVPGLLRRRGLHEDLEALVAARTENPRFFGPTPVFRVYLNDETGPVPAEDLQICDLEEWGRQPSTRDRRVAVDPVLGRLTIRKDEAVSRVEVTYTYAFGADFGGGPYNREESVSHAVNPKKPGSLGVPETAWRRTVASGPGAPADSVDSLSTAIDEWNRLAGERTGIILIADSRTYDVAQAETIEIPDGCRLLVVAAGWRPRDITTSQVSEIVGDLTPTGRRPHLIGDFEVRGTAPEDAVNPGTLVLDGLLFEGSLTAKPGNLGTLRIAHSTLVPDEGGLLVKPATGAKGENDKLLVELDHVISGPVALAETVPALRISDSIIDGGDDAAIPAKGTDVAADRSTVLGTAAVRSIEASNSIFNGTLEATRTQFGCFRFSFVPADSRTPRRYRCQPDGALAERARRLGLESAADLDNEERAGVLLRVRPSFDSLAHGDPSYAQLSEFCPREIAAGGEEGSEMGVFHGLMQPNREANLRLRFSEYLPFGLEGGLIRARYEEGEEQ